MAYNQMYLEEEVSRASRDDGHFDSIIPYMMSTQPIFTFADSYSQSVPEFYLDYPIFVNADEFEENDLDEQHHTIYKVYDPSQEDSSSVIQILPEDSVYTLNSEVLDIALYYVKVKDGKKIYEEVISEGLSDSFINLNGFTLHESDFYINNKTGTFTLLEGLVRRLSLLKSKRDYENYEEGSSSFFVFEFKIEKYRSTADLNGMTAEEVNTITTMQQIHSNILEYTYYHKIAEQSQEKLSQIAYTAFVTAISTLITLPASIAAGAYMGYVKAGAVADKAIKLGTMSAAEVSKWSSMTFSKFAIDQVGSVSIKLVFKVLIKPIIAMVSEICDEIFLDPWIESYVSKITEDLGLWGQTLLTSLAESGRESIFSGMSIGFQAGYNSITSSQIKNTITQNDLSADMVSSLEASNMKKAKVINAMEGVMTGIMLFAPILSTLAGGALGSSLSAGLALIGSIDIDISSRFEAIAKQYHQIHNQIIESAASEFMDNAVDNTIDHLVSQMVEEFPEVSEESIDKTSMLHPVQLSGMKYPINGYTGRQVFFMGREDVDHIMTRIDEDKQSQKRKNQDSKRPKIQQTLEGKDLLPSKAERIISREFGGKKHYTQEYMKNLWKLGKTESNDGKYIFGMIYQWTHEKEGKVHVYPGRTERRRGTPDFRPYSSISVRFDEEIRTAITTRISKLKTKNNQMYYDMRIIYNNAGGGQKGINAIVKNFKLEIVELQVISESYEEDKIIIEHLEDYWLEVAILKGYESYTKAGGKWGSHVPERTGAHGRKSTHKKARDMIRHGFSKKEIAQYFGFPYTPPYGSLKLNRFLSEVLDGRSFTQVRSEEISEEILNLIDNGVLTIPDLASFFRGMTSVDLFNFLKSLQFTSNKGVMFLNGLVSSAILELRKETEFTYNDVMDKLGIGKGGSHLLSIYMKKEMKPISNIKEDDLISWLKPYAKMLIRHCDSAFELLTLLNWDQDLTSQMVDDRIKILFGMNFNEAKKSFTSGILNK